MVLVCTMVHVRTYMHIRKQASRIIHYEMHNTPPWRDSVFHCAPIACPLPLRIKNLTYKVALTGLLAPPLTFRSWAGDVQS